MLGCSVGCEKTHCAFWGAVEREGEREKEIEKEKKSNKREKRQKKFAKKSDRGQNDRR
jgi:hypothetical protein